MSSFCYKHLVVFSWVFFFEISKNMYLTLESLTHEICACFILLDKFKLFSKAVLSTYVPLGHTKLLGAPYQQVLIFVGF